MVNSPDLRSGEEKLDTKNMLWTKEVRAAAELVHDIDEDFAMFGSLALATWISKLPKGEQSKFDLKASPEVDLFTTSAGVDKLVEKLSRMKFKEVQSEEEAKKLGGESLFWVESGNQVAPDLDNPIRSKRLTAYFRNKESGKLMAIEVWSGIGEGMIASDSDSKKVLTGVSVDQSSEVEFGEKVIDKIGIRVFQPAALVKLYRFVWRKERMKEGLGLKVKNDSEKDREKKMEMAQRLAEIWHK